MRPDYAGKLLARFVERTEDGGRQTESSSSVYRPPSLVAPLSERELDVLRLFKTELSAGDRP
jgi:hypothetical protein